MVLVVKLLLGVHLGLGLQVESRVAVVDELMCREAPGPSGTVVGSFELGQAMEVRARRHLEGHTEPWLLVGSVYLRGSCWVYGGLTELFDRERPEEALLAMSARVLASARGRPFEDFVRVENLFRDPPWRGKIDSLPELSLARLDLVDKAAATELRWELEKDPLKVAWILSHEDVLAYNEPGGEWLVGREAYWNLYERFKESDLAEDLAWKAASRPRRGECEGFSECTLRAITETVAEYWIRYPNGAHLPEAMEIARDWTEATLENCERRDRGSGVPLSLLEEVRLSLEPVRSERKGLVLEDLERIERSCAKDGG